MGSSAFIRPGFRGFFPKLSRKIRVRSSCRRSPSVPSKTWSFRPFLRVPAREQNVPVFSARLARARGFGRRWRARERDFRGTRACAGHGRRPPTPARSVVTFRYNNRVLDGSAAARPRNFKTALPAHRDLFFFFFLSGPPNTTRSLYRVLLLSRIARIFFVFAPFVAVRTLDEVRLRKRFLNSRVHSCVNF